MARHLSPSPRRRARRCAPGSCCSRASRAGSRRRRRRPASAAPARAAAERALSTGPLRGGPTRWPTRSATNRASRCFARGPYRRGRQNAEAEKVLQPAVGRKPDRRRRARTRSAAAVCWAAASKRAHAAALLSRDIAGARRATTARRRGPRARSAASRDANASTARRSRWRRTSPANTAWGELFLEKHNQHGSGAHRSRRRSKPTPEHPAGAAGHGAHAWPTTTRRWPRKLRPAGAGAQPQRRRRAPAARRARARRRQAPRGAGRGRQGAGDQPEQPRGAALSAALACLEASADDYQAAIAAAALEDQSALRRGLSRRRQVAARNYRFDEAAEHTRRAIDDRSRERRAHADLGAHLMRTGDERNARRALEMAFRADPFDVVTYNLLGLLDTLDELRDDPRRRHGDQAASRRRRRDARVRAGAGAGGARALSKRWNFTPKGPILIEMFPRHDDFAVRTSGLPGMIGALGACFGRVVTMDSPKARPPGEFNWGATLWHEMAHVITLQLSNQRIPRWLTEGISVFEEKRARPEWGREMEVPFAGAMDGGRDDASCRSQRRLSESPRRSRWPITRRRCSSSTSWPRFGEPTLRALRAVVCRRHRDGGGESQRCSSVDDRCAAEVVRRLSRRALRRAAPRARRARGLRARQPLDKLRALATANPGQLRGADGARPRAQATDPRGARRVRTGRRAGADGHRRRRARTCRSSSCTRAAATRRGRAEALEKLTAQDHTDVDVARQLVGLLDPQTAAGAAALQRVVAVDPFDAAAHTALGRMALAADKPPEAIRVFRVALAAGPVDRAARTPISPRAFGGRRSATRPSARRCRARNRADLRARAGSAAQAGRGARSDGPVARRSGGAPSLAAACCVASRLVACSRRAVAGRTRPRRPRVRATIASPACSGPSRASDTRRRPATWRAHAPRLLGRAVGHRRASRRAEPVAPAADGTAIEVDEPIVMTLDDPKLWQHPWIYIVEPSNLVLSDKERRRCASSCCAAAR